MQGPVRNFCGLYSEFAPKRKNNLFMLGESFLQLSNTLIMDVQVFFVMRIVCFQILLSYYSAEGTSTSNDS